MTEFTVISKGVRFCVRREGWTYRVSYGDAVDYCMTWRGVLRVIGRVV